MSTRGFRRSRYRDRVFDGVGCSGSPLFAVCVAALSAPLGTADGLRRGGEGGDESILGQKLEPSFLGCYGEPSSDGECMHG